MTQIVKEELEPWLVDPGKICLISRLFAVYVGWNASQLCTELLQVIICKSLHRSLWTMNQSAFHSSCQGLEHFSHCSRRGSPVWLVFFTAVWSRQAMVVSLPMMWRTELGGNRWLSQIAVKWQLGIHLLGDVHTQTPTYIEPIKSTQM